MTCTSQISVIEGRCIPNTPISRPNAEIVQKQNTDSFHHTRLGESLEDVDELLVYEVMTQNYVTHTSISKKAEKYTVLAR